MEKKQTAVQFYEKNHRNLLIRLENKEISIGQYAVLGFELYKQALQIEREQIEEAFNCGDCNGTFETVNRKQYYTQTFKH